MTTTPERVAELRKMHEADARFVEHTGARTVSYLWLERCRELLALAAEHLAWMPLPEPPTEEPTDA